MKRFGSELMRAFLKDNCRKQSSSSVVTALFGAASQPPLFKLPLDRRERGGILTNIVA